MYSTSDVFILGGRGGGDLLRCFFFNRVGACYLVVLAVPMVPSHQSRSSLRSFFREFALPPYSSPITHHLAEGKEDKPPLFYELCKYSGEFMYNYIRNARNVAHLG
jgi:hypothetical protein